MRPLAIAKHIKALTYDEMMEIADWFAQSIKTRGECDDHFDNSDHNEWADILSSWAGSTIEEYETE
jgi:hypothetical protein